MLATARLLSNTIDCYLVNISKTKLNQWLAALATLTCAALHFALCNALNASDPIDSVYSHSNRVAESPSCPAAPLSVQQAEQAGSAARAGGAVVFLVYFCACFYSLRGTRKMGSADWKRAAAAAVDDVVAFIAQLGGILLSLSPSVLPV